MILLWIGVFIVSLIVLVKGADWLLESSERIGLALGLSPFIIGVTIVGIGTSFPELISSLAAVIQGVTDIVPANAIGSNIANILLVIGGAALIGRRLSISKNLIDLDIPLLASATVLFLVAAWDRVITLPEGVLLVLAAIIYVVYNARQRDDVGVANGVKAKKKRPKIDGKHYLYLVLGIAGLAVGAHYMVRSVIELSTLLDIGTGIIALAAVAFGTSVPELIVSIKAALQKKPEVALGNIFGSNVFNLLAVVGIPALFRPLVVSDSTFALGLPFLIGATFLFLISGISRRVHNWEGALYLLIYVFFIGKLFDLI